MTITLNGKRLGAYIWVSFSNAAVGQWQHNNVQINLTYQAKSGINNNDCNYIVFTKLDWKINNETVVCPDVMIV